MTNCRLPGAWVSRPCQRIALLLGAAFALSATSAAQSITYAKVVRVNDPVPGRPATIAFVGGASESHGILSRPSINNAGRVAFRGVSANSFNSTQDRAVGIYANTSALAVLADTTSAFEVPGRPGVRFTDFDPPLLTDGDVVVFRGVFNGGSGFYAVSVLGGTITKLAESGAIGTPVPNTAGAATLATFNSGGFSAGIDTPVWIAATKNAASATEHYFSFIARFTDSGNPFIGVFGGTFSAGGPVTMRRIADDSATIASLNQPTLTIRGIDEVFPPALNSNGSLIFGCRVAAGLVRAVMTDSLASAALTTRARENQSSGTAFGNYGSTFEGFEINDAGRYLFQHRFNSGAAALFTDTLAGGAFRTVVDTSATFSVPARAGATFTSFAVAAINESGQLGFYATDNVVGVTTPQGLYEADLASCLSPDCVARVANNSMVPPGRVPPALFSRFEAGSFGISAAIDDNGNMAFAPIAVASPGVNLFGLYYYSRCSGSLERIFDKDAPGLPGGGTFAASGTRGTRIYQGLEVRSGQYRAMNNSGQVAFQVEYGPGEFGVYVATVAGGGVEITCPADITLECGEDYSALSTGTATATGCGTIAINHVDAVTPDCGQTRVIARTWTASNGTSSDSCVQTITVEDTTAPTIAVPVAAGISCSASTQPSNTGVATASDVCDSASAITFADAITVGDCPAEYIITRTWKATDACGNFSTATQLITVSSSAIPALSVPADVNLSCGDSTLPANTGTAIGSAACGSESSIEYVDDTTAGTCAGDQIIERTWTITDACGNTASATQLISVTDDQLPTITAPAGVNADCGESTDPAETGSATATDACSGIATIGHSDVIVPGDCPASYTIARTWTATDGCGNAATVVQYIFVIDGAAPTLTIPGDVTVQCTDPTGPTFTGQATASDTCSTIGSITWSDEETTEACVSQRVKVIGRTWTATDACGNSVSQLQTITVLDTVAPLLTVPPTVTMACGDSTDTSITGLATAYDACDAHPIVTFYDHTAAGTCPTTSVVTRTWTATDACGNVSSGTQLISLIDNAPPVLICPADVDVELPHGHCQAASLDIGHATATDLCSEPTVDNDAPAVFPAGTTYVRWTATDACGNVTCCTQSVTVSDSQPPAICALVCTTMLWPPNHDLVPVGLFVRVSDACDSGIQPVIRVYSNENDETATGDGNHSPDARNIGNATLRLRRERIGSGDGRVYLIIASATDSSGNTATTSCTVVVPQSRSFHSLMDVVLEAAYAQAYCHHHHAAPPDFVLVGDGPIIGPKQ